MVNGMGGRRLAVAPMLGLAALGGAGHCAPTAAVWLDSYYSVWQPASGWVTFRADSPQQAVSPLHILHVYLTFISRLSRV